mmetsp:Transcript_4261/g.12835  ORF Transcript_4261/g.12835 Transcript_4261/m.12835 type:complete len:265 (+) Transcript_4261:367-1161(+)
MGSFATPVDLPGGGRMTMNAMGLEMSTTSPLLNEWVAAYDGRHPLVDIGCAYGKNTCAAADIVKAAIGTPAPDEVRVVACDFEEGHLAYTRAHAPPGVKTTFAKLPDALPDVEKASGILIAEVLHFVDGAAIDATLAWAARVLVPGGVVALHGCTPWMNCAPDVTGACPIASAALPLYEAHAGEPWPGDSGVDPRELMARASLAGMPNENLPTYFHVFASQDLAAACERAGLEVVLARDAWHSGYPSQYANDGRECAQVVARKI